MIQNNKLKTMQSKLNTFKTIDNKTLSP